MRKVAVFNDDFPRGVYALLKGMLDIEFFPYSDIDSTASRKEDVSGTDMIVLRDQREIECRCHYEFSEDNTIYALRILRPSYTGDIAVWFALTCPHEYDYIFHEGADLVVEPRDFIEFMRNYANGSITNVHFNPDKYEQRKDGLIVSRKQKVA